MKDLVPLIPDHYEDISCFEGYESQWLYLLKMPLVFSSSYFHHFTRIISSHPFSNLFLSMLGKPGVACLRCWLSAYQRVSSCKKQTPILKVNPKSIKMLMFDSRTHMYIYHLITLYRQHKCTFAHREGEICTFTLM